LRATEDKISSLYKQTAPTGRMALFVCTGALFASYGKGAPDEQSRI
jgi:hypothetical protein